MRIPSAMLAVLSLATGVRAQTGGSPTEQIDAYVTAELHARHIPGAVIAIAENGSLAYSKAFGIADVEAASAMRADSIFQLASITKPFTAASVMLLYEQGLVKLDEPVGTYVKSAPPAWAGVTVRHLLTHTSGLAPAPVVFREGIPLLRIPIALAFDAVATAPPLSAPGARAMYNDAAYFVLGMVIEAASGMPYGEFLRKRFFEPLGMSKTSMLDKAKVVPGRVPVYSLRNGELVHWRRDWQHDLNSFAGICSTAEDLIRWDLAVRAGKVLKPESLAASWTPAKLGDGSDAIVDGSNYGFGWYLTDYRGHPLAEHSGASGTHLLHFLDRPVSVVVLTNLDGPSGSRVFDLARGVAGRWKPEFSAPEVMKPVPDPDPKVTGRIQAMLGEMAKHQEPAAMTAAHRAFLRGLPPPARTRFESLAGAAQELTFVGRDAVTDPRVRRLGDAVAEVRYYLAPTSGWTFWLTKDGSVAYLSAGGR